MIGAWWKMTVDREKCSDQRQPSEYNLWIVQCRPLHFSCCWTSTACTWPQPLTSTRKIIPQKAKFWKKKLNLKRFFSFFLLQLLVDLDWLHFSICQRRPTALFQPVYSRCCWCCWHPILLHCSSHLMMAFSSYCWQLSVCPRLENYSCKLLSL